MPVTGPPAIPSRKKAGVPQSAVNEAHAVAMVGTVSGGTWKATGTTDAGGSAQTGTIAWNAAPSVVVAAFAAAGITVTVDTNTQALASHPLIITYGDRAAKTLLTIDSSALTGGGTYAATRLAAGTAGDFAGAAVGDLAMDTTTGLVYSNTGTASVPIWSLASPGAAAYLRRGANLIIGFGDSITAGSGRGTFPAFGMAQGGNLALLTEKDWLMWAALTANGALRYVGNVAMSGDTTANMVSRLAHLQYLIAQFPANSVSVTVMGGTNDANGAVAFATTVANLRTIYAAVLAAGATPIACTIPPINGRTTTVEQAADKINAWVRYNAARSRMPLFDAYTVLTDVANGNYKTGYNADTLHPNGTGAAAMGQNLWNSTLAGIVPPSAAWLPTSTSDGTSGTGFSLLQNPLFVDSNVDGLADNWTVFGAGVGTKSIVTDAAIFGGWQRITYTSGFQPAIIQTIGSAWSVGDRLAFVGRIQSSLLAATAQGTALVSLTFNGAPGTPTLTPHSSWATADIPSGVFYIEGVVPVGTTSIFAQLAVNSGNTTSGPWVQIAQAAVLNLTALGF